MLKVFGGLGGYPSSNCPMHPQEGEHVMQIASDFDSKVDHFAKLCEKHDLLVPYEQELSVRIMNLTSEGRTGSRLVPCTTVL